MSTGGRDGYSSVEIATFTKQRLAGDQTNSFKRPDGTSCRKFNKEHQVDADNTRRLYKGKCKNDSSIDYGKLRLTLAYDSQPDQTLAKEYVLKEIACDAALMKNFNEHNLLTRRGLEEATKPIKELLAMRFDLVVTKFVKQWDWVQLRYLANAYAVVFKDQIDSMKQAATLPNPLVTLKLQRHDELLGIIISHSDMIFDKTTDDIATLTTLLAKMKEESDSQYNLYQELVERLKEVEDEVVDLRDRVELLELASRQEPNSTSTEKPRRLFLTPLTATEKEIYEKTLQLDSFRRLQPGIWLNGDIIDDFMKVVTKYNVSFSCHFISTQFMSMLLDLGNEKELPGYKYRLVKRWGAKCRGGDIFKLDKLFVPIHVGGIHWFLVEIRMAAKEMQVYDPMGKSRYGYMNHLLHYLKDEHLSKKGVPLPDVEKWVLIGTDPSVTPQQTNGYDCGVFVCMFGYFLTLGQDMDFNQAQIDTYGRPFIGLSIVNGSFAF